MPSYTREDLLELAGAKSYDRGVHYVAQVEEVVLDGRTVRGTVHGTDAYQVELTPLRNGMEWDCDCPWAEDGNFCKHCVALGLVHLYNADHGVETPRAPDLQAYLRSLSTTDLVELVLEATDASPELRGRLELRASAAGYGSNDSGADNADSAGRSLVEAALRVTGFVEYTEARVYADRVHEVARLVEMKTEQGMATMAEELARHAATLLDQQAGVVDDSGGHIGEAGARLLDAHVQACEIAAPESRALAEWLLDLQLDGTGLTDPQMGDYAGVLGEEGLEHYRRELFEGDTGETANSWSTGFLKSEYAREVGDTDLLVQTLASQGSGAYPGIVSVLDDAGRGAEALEWAEKGLSEGSRHVSGRLVEYAVQAHRAAGRAEEAQRLRWEAFERNPMVYTYRALHRDFPDDQWPTVRGQALTVLSRSAARRQARHFPCSLVEVLVDEGCAGEAWVAATEHGCDPHQWLRVAALREKDRPEDAAAVYVHAAQERVVRVDTSLYPEAADLARRGRDLYERAGQPEEARSFVERIRSEHHRKRRFLAELDRVGL
ncbi:SWIM zinc finger family protein [Nocardiopsis kunsanensis]|nr:DUF6880 family protein [Nocardiopsis kunsanensis]